MPLHIPLLISELLERRMKHTPTPLKTIVEKGFLQKLHIEKCTKSILKFIITWQR